MQRVIIDLPFSFSSLNLVRCRSILSLEALMDPIKSSAISAVVKKKDFSNTGFMKDHLFKELEVNNILV